jgi:hypothetical protein
MAIIKKFSPFQNLSNFSTFVDDDNPNSEYFKITEFKETFTGGKNGFLIEGCPELKESSEVKIELLDVEGNPIYFEPGDGIPEYYEGTSKLISVHVYEDTPIGLGKITILGELKQYKDSFGALVDIPNEWRGVYNVKWERTFQVNKNLSNETTVRFYKRPSVTITELIKPIFSKSIPTVTDTGHVHGFSITPSVGENITTWRAGTSYGLRLTSGSWDVDVDENIITISNPSYQARIIEVLDSKQVLVDIPYTENNIVTDFESGSYSVTYTDFQNQVVGETSLTGSFAKVDISQLKTFVGDVARVKVFRKSRNAVGDFQFVQESKLESSELLRDITTTSDTELSYGRFDENNLTNYWVTSSDSHPTSINSDVLSQAVKIDYDENVGGVQRLITSESISVSSDVEYTLNFRTLLSGSLDDSGKTIRAFFSSSNFTQDFTTISGSAIYRARQNISENIISQNTGDAKLVFEVQGSDWYISNVSLRNAQESSFSPDEFTLIQDIPRKTASETFDFRFEFYDINNNYIPVDVSAVGVFNGGNDFPTSAKLLTFESDRNAFRFSSGSVQNPKNQQIQLKITQNNLTGSILFESSAFDVDGNYLNPNDYTQYPGLLTGVNPAGGLITINNFTGSRTDNSPTPFVGSVIYTASLENLQEFETVYRLEDGDNAPQLIVTSNANQFTYEPTALEPKPSGQSITVRAQRKNLASLITPIEINSGSNKPKLNYVDTVNGIDTYTLTATTFSASFSDNSFDEVTYSFTGSDVFGNKQSDEITISKVVNFDGVSITLTNDSTTFRANGQGAVLDNFASGDGEVEVRIANKEIQHSDGLTSPNRFDIVSATATNVTEAYSSYTTNEYGISSLSADSGSLILSVKYLAGDNSTSQSFQKKVNYTKNRIASPSIVFDTTNKTQNVDAKSTGAQLSSFDSSTMAIREFYTGSLTSFSSANIDLTITSGSNDVSGNPLVTRSGLSLSYGELPNNTNSTQVGLTATVTDSEGTSREVSDTVSLSKTNASAPNVEIQVYPSSQTITANSVGSGSATPSNLSIVVSEGGTTRTISSIGTITTTGGLSVNTPTSPFTTISFTSDASDMTSDTGTITIPVTTTNSEGSSVTKTITAIVTRAREGETPVLVTLTPQAQTITANSLGSGSESPQTISVSAKQGSTDVFDSMTVSYSGGIGGTISSNNLTFTDTASDMTSDTETITFAVTYTDSAGDTSTENITANISRTRAARPNVEVSVSPTGQTIEANSRGSGSATPQTLTVRALEGGTSRFEEITNVSFSNGLDGDDSPLSNTVAFTSTATDMTSDTGTATVTVSYQDSEGTLGTKDVIATVSRVRVAQPGINFSVTPAAQTIAANSNGTLTGTIQDVRVDGFEGNSALTYNQGTLSAGQYKITNVTGVSVSDTTPSDENIDITGFSGDSATGTAFIGFKDNEGTTGTTTIKFTLSKSKKATPVVAISANPQSQTVDSNSAFSSVGTPSAVTIIVNEGGSNYTHTTGTVTANKFKITGVTNGTNNNDGTITPTTPSDANGTTSVVTLSYTNSEGREFTSKTITVNVGVAVQGDDGAAGPGITFVGDCSDLASTFTWTSDENTRQVTKVGSSYYITKDAADGVAKSTTGCPGDTGWGTYFETMTSFASVATDVLFAQDVYANKTVNIGTSPNGTEPVIALNADASNDYANPYIGIGTSAYNGTGIFLGYNSDVAKLSLKSSTNSLLWDGTNLTVNGGGTFSGDLSAAGGTFEGSLSVGSGDDILKVDSSGNLHIGDANYADAPFKVSNDGALTATGATISGAITITSGDTADAIAQAKSVADAATGSAATALSAAQGAQQDVDNLNIPTVPTTFNPNNLSNVGTPSVSGLHLGEDKMGFYNATAPAGWKSYLDSSGNFFLAGTNSGAAAPLSFTGTTGILSVTTGATIGGWTIDSNSIHTGTKGSSGNFTSAGAITIGSSGFISANGFYIDTDGNFVQETTKTKLKKDGVATPRALSNLFDIDSSEIFIKTAAKIGSGTQKGSFSTAFAFDTDGTFSLNNDFRIKGSSSGIGTRFNTISTNFSAIDTRDGFCVLPGTKIISKRGEINVEDTKEDDVIKIFNFETKEWGWSSIDEIITNKVQGWSKIETELGKKLKCSNSHLLYHPDYPNCEISVDKLGVGGELYVYADGRLVIDKIKSIETFDEEVEVWNYELDVVHNYISDGILSHNMSAKLDAVVTLGHAYKKRISENISRGDLVKVDSNNELIKVSSAKDTSVVGILWEKYELKITNLITGSVEDGYTPFTASEEMVSASYLDSFGNYLTNNETGSKEMWRVASLGDSIEWNISGSYFSLTGFKMCNQGGDVVPGDLLCSSDTPGYLMKQPSEWVVTGFNGDSTPIYEERQSQCSYTVAKSMESSSWDSNGKMEGVYGYLYCG